MTRDVTLISSTNSIYVVLYEPNLYEYGIIYSIWDLIHLIMWKQENNVLKFRSSNIWKDQIHIPKDHIRHTDSSLSPVNTHIWKSVDMSIMCLYLPASWSLTEYQYHFTITSFWKSQIQYMLSILLSFQFCVCNKYKVECT